ncbi:MAG: ABC transporter permease [Vicinamibacterales bacterium]
MRFSVRRSAAIVLRQIYLLRGSLARFVPLFAWVGVDMVLWGFMTRYLNSISHAGFDFVAMLLGAVLLWDFFARVMQGVTTAFLEDVWSRNFLNLFASPLSVGEYLTGLVASSIVTSSVGLAVMLVLASAVFGLSFLSYGLPLVAWVFVLFLCGIALGIAASGLVLLLGPASEWFIWPMPALIAPFAGVYYPVSTLPVWMRAVARIVPPATVFEGMRAVVAGQGLSLSALAWGTFLAVAYLGLACVWFRAVYRRAVRTGLIARYSAETLS